jgi:hypothetical protein
MKKILLSFSLLFAFVTMLRAQSANTAYSTNFMEQPFQRLNLRFVAMKSYMNVFKKQNKRKLVM